MVVCKEKSSYCPFTITFGIISIIFLILVVTQIQDTALLKYNSRKHIATLFIARFLCISMVLVYFLPFYSQIFFFIKEFSLLLTYSAVAYYFIFQAGFLLFEYTIYRYTLYGSLFLTALSLVILVLYFITTFFLFGESIPCDSPSWIIMRSLGLALSLLCITVSLWIHFKLSKLSKNLNLTQIKSRLNYLW